MLGTYVASDLELDSISKALPLQTEWGSTLFTRGLKDPTSDIPLLKQRQLPLFTLKHPSMKDTLSSLCQDISNSIVPLQTFINESCMPKQDLDPRVRESIQQIVWAPESQISFLNTTPHVLQGLVTWKTLLLPGISILMPILAIVVPFVLLRFLHGSEHISTTDYLQHVKTVLLKQVTVPPMLRAKHSGDVFGYILESLFIGITVATFISGIWNQVMSAIHLRSLASDVYDRGSAILTTVQTCRKIITTLQTCPSRFQKAMRRFLERGEAVLNNFKELPTDPFAAFGFIWNTPSPLLELRDWIGTLDVYTSIASVPNICFPAWKSAHLTIKGVRHPLVEKSIPNNGFFTNHVLLTGPNRGGKSTFCKSVGLAIVCAQSWGFAWATSMKLTPFTAIETALSPADELGKLSLFEAEIEFAKSVLEKCDKEANTLVMMDEIFHSTNARDGVAASHVFLDKLYTKPHTTSLISTHYRELVEAYKPKGILPWAMDATETPDGLQYSYHVTVGISDKSSVMEILKERGLT